MLWVSVGGHRSLLMGMVWVWVQIRRKMLGSVRLLESTTISTLFKKCMQSWNESRHKIQ